MRVGINTVGIRPGWGGAEETFLRQLLRELSKYDASISIVVFSDEENDASFPESERVQVGSAREVEEASSAAGIDVLLTSLDRLPGGAGVRVLPYATNVRALEEAAGARRLLGGSPLKRLRAKLAGFPVTLASSKYIQQRLLQLLEIPLNKVVIAPFGVDPVFGSEQDCIVEKPFLLSVGNTSRWKNLDVLLTAFQRIENEVPHNLTIVGRPSEAEPKAWGERVIRIDRLPQANLAGLYQHCEAFVRTATTDGTAITVLEAMASGATVAAPRSGAVGEVGGNAPLYFNGESVDSLVGTLRRVAQMTASEHEQRGTLGRQTAAAYTWEHCSKQVLKALRRAAE